MHSRVTRTILFLLMVFCAMPAFAQQIGTISGKVLDQSGAAMPGVTVEARSTVLPGPRVSVTSATGTYQLAALPPGEYTIVFTLSGMQTVTRKAEVLLSQDVAINATMAVGGVKETVTVTAQAGYAEKTTAAINSTLSNDIFKDLPVGTEYRDLVKLIPGVMYTQDGTRGPSAGGSGQDNVYNFDGVNVTLPLFGTLASEPASHDIAQIAIVKGGARAVDFNRAGGFSMDSVSKSGTSKLSGDVSFKLQDPSMRAQLVTCKTVTTPVTSCNNTGRMYTDVSMGAPVLKDKLFFYGSYYQPHFTRKNVSNNYGPLPNYTSDRYEGFGKLTLTPLKGVLLNASYRASKRVDKSTSFGSFVTVSTGYGGQTSQTIFTADGSWIISANSFVSFKMTHFGTPGKTRPDNASPAIAGTTIGTQLDIANLDTQGYLNVPVANVASSNPNSVTANAFRQAYINKYGYVDASGVRQGGGAVGYWNTLDQDDFFRTSGQIGYNLTLNAGQTRHDLHVGYQQYVDSEDLVRTSNGWGTLSVIGGSTTAPVAAGGQPIFFQALFFQQTTGLIPKIHSEFRSKNLEFNDAIAFRNLALNIGVLASNDTLYGQGLTPDANAPSGFVKSTGTTAESRQYTMLNIPFSKMIQPRISATYAYDGANTIYASWAKYNPAASSLPRAASWDRSTNAAIVNGYFDAGGKLTGTDTVLSSSGKLFVPGMTPRTTSEYLIGSARQFGNLSVRVYGRYRYSSHFWEDTNNNARIAYREVGMTRTPDSVPATYYIENLGTQLATLGGSQNSYVIAELDGAFTKYRELTTEAEWRGNVAGNQLFLRGSYTWSHYFGNVDQDGTTTANSNDANIFIGSSNIGDSGGRQLWDFKLGDLHGDRRHMAKVYGSYQLPWNGSAGFYAVYQSGQPWEATNRNFYPKSIIGTSTSDLVRYAEAAGSRVTPSHYQVDLNYTQSLNISRYRIQLVGELFNVANKQTGYNAQPSVNSASFGNYLSYWEPRRFIVTAKIGF